MGPCCTLPSLSWADATYDWITLHDMDELVIVGMVANGQGCLVGVTKKTMASLWHGAPAASP